MRLIIALSVIGDWQRSVLQHQE